MKPRLSAFISVLFLFLLCGCGTKPAPEPIFKLELLRSHGHKNARTGWLIIEGQVKNTGNTTLRNLFVYGGWWQGEERIIEKMWELPHHLFEPGETTAFTVAIPFWNAPCDAGMHYRIRFHGERGPISLEDGRAVAGGRRNEFTLLGQGCELIPENGGRK